jgi:hypothetical protein
MSNDDNSDPGSDCSGALGGDGFMGRYYGCGVATLGLLLQGQQRHRHAGARRGGT